MAIQGKRFIPLAVMEQLLKKAGADRVSDSAKIAMKEVLEDLAEEISKKAVTLAGHAGRKTIKSDDIKLASKGLFS